MTTNGLPLSEQVKAALAQMEKVRTETLSRLAPLTQDQLDWRAPEADGEEGWSLGEIFMHLALDEHYLRENIARPLLEGVQPPAGIHFIPPGPPHGTKKDVIEFWFARAREATRQYLATLPSDANLTLKHEGGLELMNGIEWLFGYAGHEAYHHQQIDRVIEMTLEIQTAAD